MVDRITGYTSGVIAPTSTRISRPVTGEALNQRVLPRRGRDEHGHPSDDDQQQKPPSKDDSVDVQIGQHDTESEMDADAQHQNNAARKLYGGQAYPAGPRGYSADSSEDVLISHSTAILLADDLSALIQRAVTNVALVTRGLMRVPERAVNDVERRFHIAALASVREAREIYVRRGGRMPHGLVFENIETRYDELRGTAEMSIGQAEFVDRIDLRAKGVVFDIRGHGAVHEPTPGIFVDTGDRGAMIANTIIETVRRDLPDFGGGGSTEGAIVIIRADDSDFSNHKTPAEVLCFDLILPFRAR